MKHKTADLEGALLDAAVAKALGHEWRIDDDTIVYVKGRQQDPQQESAFCPSMYWDHGGPLIQRERIAVFSDGSEAWRAGFDLMPGDDDDLLLTHAHHGRTPLIAAMRAFVCAKLGNEVEL